MGQKISYDAENPKKGMTLAELQNAITQAASLAQGVNNKALEDCKVTVFVNFSAGIKQLIVEV
jgi:hypothetical protein